MINENEYEIRTGIKKEDIRLLNQYLISVEESHALSRVLSQIIDDNPSVLYDPKPVELKGTYSFQDLAFLYDGSSIIGHYCHKFTREETPQGHHTIMKLEEQNVPTGFSDELRRQYIMNRVTGKMNAKGTSYEKSR